MGKVFSGAGVGMAVLKRWGQGMEVKLWFTFSPSVAHWRGNQRGIPLAAIALWPGDISMDFQSL